MIDGPEHFRAHRSRARRQQPQHPDLGAFRQGDGAGARRAAGIELDAAAAAKLDRVKDSSRRVPLRSRRCVLRSADPQGSPGIRAAVQPRELRARLRRNSGRQSPDRGDDQDLGRRRALRTHRRRKRSGQRARQRAARCDRREVSAPQRHRPRQLQGPHSQRDEGHRRGHSRAARCI